MCDMGGFLGEPVGCSEISAKEPNLAVDRQCRVTSSRATKAVMAVTERSIWSHKPSHVRCVTQRTLGCNESHCTFSVSGPKWGQERADRTSSP